MAAAARAEVSAAGGGLQASPFASVPSSYVGRWVVKESNAVYPAAVFPSNLVLGLLFFL